MQRLNGHRDMERRGGEDARPMPATSFATSPPSLTHTRAVTRRGCLQASLRTCRPPWPRPSSLLTAPRTGIWRSSASSAHHRSGRRPSCTHTAHGRFHVVCLPALAAPRKPLATYHQLPAVTSAGCMLASSLVHACATNLSTESTHAWPVCACRVRKGPVAVQRQAHNAAGTAPTGSTCMCHGPPHQQWA